jgi:NAD+ kinase
VPGTDLMISIGGDGTILRTVRVSYPAPIPILGINFGKLGFMTELKADEALKQMPFVLDGAGWIEERALLEATLPEKNRIFYALNDVFVGRRSSARVVTVEAKINSELAASYKADGVLVSTASGSTGYAMAVSGPILHPESRNMLLKPVCAHFTFDKALVLAPETHISLKVITTHEAMISSDGQVELQLQSGDTIEVKLAEQRACFLRLQSKSYFYSTLESKLRERVV